jgi:hypothetical protein
VSFVDMNCRFRFIAKDDDPPTKKPTHDRVGFIRLSDLGNRS